MLIKKKNRVMNRMKKKKSQYGSKLARKRKHQHPPRLPRCYAFKCNTDTCQQLTFNIHSMCHIGKIVVRLRCPSGTDLVVPRMLGYAAVLHPSLISITCFNGANE